MGKKILVVDDDPDILEFVQLMLEDAGYIVSVVEKVDAIDVLIANERPDVIVLDMLLSGNDGRVMVKRWKNQEATRHIPVLMLSAHPSAKNEAQAAGADDFLAKPFEMEDLLTKVAQYV